MNDAIKKVLVIGIRILFAIAVGFICGYSIANSHNNGTIRNLEEQINRAETENTELGKQLTDSQERIKNSITEIERIKTANQELERKNTELRNGINNSLSIIANGIDETAGITEIIDEIIRGIEELQKTIN